MLGHHRALASPGYGTQPLHWHQSQNRPKRCQKEPKSAKKTGQKGGDFGSTIRTRRESQCLPYAGFFGWLPQLVKLYFKKASSFPRLLPIISQVLLPSSARLPEHFCHLGKGEGNENREVEKVEVEGRRGRGEEEDRGGGRGGRN